MTLTTLDLGLLGKVLALTTSDRDPEALAAIRQANRILSGAGTTWPDLLAKAVPPTADDGIAPQGIGSYYPPYGRTWRETVRHLIEVDAARGLYDKAVLDAAARELADGDRKRPKIGSRTAADITEIWLAHERRSQRA